MGGGEVEGLGEGESNGIGELFSDGRLVLSFLRAVSSSL